MSGTEITIDFTTAMEQAKSTAHDYLYSACNILDKVEGKGEWKPEHAIELCKVMAQDFHSTMMGIKMQEIRDKLGCLEDAIDYIAQRIPENE